MKRIATIFGAALLALSAMPAEAARLFDFEFVAAPWIGDGVIGRGRLTTDDGAAGVDGTTYTVADITGSLTFDYEGASTYAITGLIDDIFGPTTIFQDEAGGLVLDHLAFAVDGPLGFYAIYRPIARSEAPGAGTTTGGYAGSNGEIFSNDVAVTLSAATAAVPEPAAWALMIGGFGAAGAMLRRRPAPRSLAAA